MTDYGVLFRELAVPRLVGTPNHAQVRTVLTRELEARGFTVQPHPFSGRPSRAFVRAPRVVAGVNLVARRATTRPTVWLVAHYDSKGQPISMLVRLLGVGLLVLGLPALLVDCMAAIVALGVGLAIVSQNRVTNDSPGALDNASALIAVFMVIDQLPSDAPVGIVFPDAEEYGLVGARALAAHHAHLFTDTALINLDGLDDTGRPTVFAHRPGSIGTAVAAALKARQWRWLPVIVDGIALAGVARECCSVLKGNVQTMLVVHTPADTVARVRLDGAASVAAGLARVLRAG